MKKVLLLSLLVIVAVPLAVCAYLSVSNPSTENKEYTGIISALVPESFSAGKNAGINAVLDATGVKDSINDYLYSNAGSIASQVGMSEDEVDNTISNLDIPSWKAASLPDGATESASRSVSYEGNDVQITTYQDCPYVTVSAMGQDLTLSVPESAQSSLYLLDYV